MFSIAYKKGKFAIIASRWIWPRDYSRASYGLDPTARVFQVGCGIISCRWNKDKAWQVNIPRIIWGPSSVVWEPVGLVREYVSNDRVFLLQSIVRHDYRPRRKPAYIASQEPWWGIVSIDGKPVITPLYLHHQASGPLMAIERYDRIASMFVLAPGHAELVKDVKMTYLF